MAMIEIHRMILGGTFDLMELLEGFHRGKNDTYTENKHN
jgi:hypothetical protein